MIGPPDGQARVQGGDLAMGVRTVLFVPVATLAAARCLGFKSRTTCRVVLTSNAREPLTDRQSREVRREGPQHNSPNRTSSGFPAFARRDSGLSGVGSPVGAGKDYGREAWDRGGSGSGTSGGGGFGGRGGGNGAVWGDDRGRTSASPSSRPSSPHMSLPESSTSLSRHGSSSGHPAAPPVGVGSGGYPHVRTGVTLPPGAGPPGGGDHHYYHHGQQHKHHREDDAPASSASGDRGSGVSGGSADGRSDDGRGSDSSSVPPPPPPRRAEGASAGPPGVMAFSGRSGSGGSSAFGAGGDGDGSAGQAGAGVSSSDVWAGPSAVSAQSRSHSPLRVTNPDTLRGFGGGRVSASGGGLRESYGSGGGVGGGGVFGSGDGSSRADVGPGGSGSGSGSSGSGSGGSSLEWSKRMHATAEAKGRVGKESAEVGHGQGRGASHWRRGIEREEPASTGQAFGDRGSGPRGARFDGGSDAGSKGHGVGGGRDAGGVGASGMPTHLLPGTTRPSGLAAIIAARTEDSPEKPVGAIARSY